MRCNSGLESCFVDFVATTHKVVDCAWSHYVAPDFLVLISRRGWFFSARLCLPDDKCLADSWVWVAETWISQDGVLKTKRGCGWSQIGERCQHTGASDPQAALLYRKRCLCACVHVHVYLSVRARVKGAEIKKFKTDTQANRYKICGNIPSNIHDVYRGKSIILAL